MDLEGNLPGQPGPAVVAREFGGTRGYGPGPWSIPGLPGNILDPRLPYFRWQLRLEGKISESTLTLPDGKVKKELGSPS